MVNEVRGGKVSDGHKLRRSGQWEFGLGHKGKGDRVSLQFEARGQEGS